MRCRSVFAALALCVAWPAAALAQMAPLPSFTVPVPSDSGFVENKGAEPAPIYATEVTVPGGLWLRLWFDEATLAGTPGIDGSYLRIISVEDGDYQILDADSIEDWSMSSAYLNGDSVIVELWAYPDTGPNRISISEVMVGEPDEFVESICDGADDRVLSYDTRQGRLSVGCTAWLINHGNSANRFLTAGHCLTNGQAGLVVFFNVPLSNSSGGFRAPAAVYQYPVQSNSIQSTNGGVGNDFATFQTGNNSNTGMPARVAQNAAYNLAASAPAASNQTLRITGYGIRDGSASPAIPLTWNSTQKTHTGPYTTKSGTAIRYRPDTTGGNSGSPVLLESSNQAIGIHTHGGCNSTGGSNAGTAIEHATLQSYLANPQGTNTLFAPLAELGTTFASNNGGSNGGAVYFDVSTGYAPVIVKAIELNVAGDLSTEFTLQVYRTPQSSVGKETNSANWTLVATGSGLATGSNNATRIVLNDSFRLERNNSYGLALVLVGNVSHRYTDGNGSNEVYSSPQLTLTGRSASNVPFSGGIFSTRVFNGKLCYQPDWIVGNRFGNDATSSASLGNGRIKAMGFTIPSGRGNQQLGSVALRLNVSGIGVQPLVRIYNSSIFTGMPSTIRATLNSPAPLPGTTTHYSFPTSPVSLLAGNTYWLVVYNQGDGTMNWNASSPAILPGGIATHAGSLFSASTGPNPPGLEDTSTIINDYAIYTVFPEPCLGDIADDFGFTANDGGGPDGKVDFGDFVALLGLIGNCPGGTPGCLGDIADDFGFTINDGGGPDGRVDFGDFVALLGLIGPCP